MEVRACAGGYEDGWLSIDGYGYLWRRYFGPPGVVPVFFLNGAFQTMESWSRFIDRLQRSRTVILCDLPGSGRADDLPWNVGVDLLARAVEQVLDRLTVPRAHFIAASYGAPIAYRFAQRCPARVGGMTLAGIARSLPQPVREGTAITVETVRSGRMEEFARQAVDMLVCRDPGRPTARREVVRRVLFTSLARMDARQQRQYIAATTRVLTHPPLDLISPPEAPTLVVTGEHDIFTRPECCREVAAALPRGSFTTVPAAGHLFHLERPDVAAGIFDRFLATSDAYVTTHAMSSSESPLTLARYSHPGSVR